MRFDKIFSGFNISSAGLSAQRKRMNAIASNIANAETTRTDEGTPYRRRVVQLHATQQQSFAQSLDTAEIGLSATDGNHFQADGNDGTTPDSATAEVTATEMDDSSPFRMIYDPTHPDANADGYVQMPNINVVTEMVDMISASRAYEANVTAITAAKTIAKDTLEI